jgi:hypothetical protein
MTSEEVTLLDCWIPLNRGGLIRLDLNQDYLFLSQRGGIEDNLEVKTERSVVLNL